MLEDPPQPYRLMGLSALTCVAWAIYAFFLLMFLREEPPRAVVVPVQTMVVNGVEMEVAIPDEALLATGEMGPFVSPDERARELREFARARWTHLAVALVCGIVAAVAGGLMFESWAWGLACLVIGPLALIRLQYGTPVARRW